MHDYLVPPDDVTGIDTKTAPWRTEYDVLSTMRDELGHDVHVLGVKDDLGAIRQANDEFKPHIAFNLLEAFHEVGTFDQNVVSYLELLRLPYTGCNPRGMFLARDKALSKKLLHYHRIPVPEFTVVARGRKPRLPKRLTLSRDREVADAGIVDRHLAGVGRRRRSAAARARAVHPRVDRDRRDRRAVHRRPGALLRRARQPAPAGVAGLGDDVREHAGGPAPHRDRAREVEREVPGEGGHRDRRGEVARRGDARRACSTSRAATYKVLEQSGYARIDLRLDARRPRATSSRRIPNPQIARTEDFAASAAAAGLTYPALLQRILTTGLRWEPERLG